MTSSVCTLFEGHFHYGLGALTNSLVAAGFRGPVWAGCRGELPFWATPLVHHENYAEFTVTPGCTIRFLPVDTPRHLTNYKPEFMLALMQRRDPADAMFYIDPDILVRSEWTFFEEWVSCGVALCEDVNSPVNPTHPLRLRWRRFFEPHGILLNSTHREYVNGGFVAAMRQHRPFLERWQRVQELMAPATAGMSGMNLGERTFLFQKTDQDALNITLYSTEVPVSIMGQEAMDFTPGGYTLSHATGADKPWRKRFVHTAFGGVPPTRPDKEFWRFADGPVVMFSKRELISKRLMLRCGAAIGRVLRRS